MSVQRAIYYCIQHQIFHKHFNGIAAANNSIYNSRYVDMYLGLYIATHSLGAEQVPTKRRNESITLLLKANTGLCNFN